MQKSQRFFAKYLFLNLNKNKNYNFYRHGKMKKHLFAFSFFTEIIVAKSKVNIHRYILSYNINTHQAALKKCRFLLSFSI